MKTPSRKPSASPNCVNSGVIWEDVVGMFQVVIDHLPCRVFWKDVNSVYLGCNQGFAEDAELDSPDDIVGKTDYELPWGKTQASEYRKDDQEVMLSGKSKLNFEEPITLGERQSEWLQTSKIPIYRRSGELVGVLCTYEFITERKEAEIALRNAQEEAERANNAKSEFLAVMSHEIRSPLNVILGYTELLFDEGKDPIKQEIYEAMMSSGQSLREIIDDVLDLSKIESKRIEIKKHPFSILTVTEKNFANMQNLATDKGLDYQFETNSDIPDVVLGDASRWGQVIRILLSNAIKFTDSGSVKVSLSAKHLRDNECLISAKISDTGPGIKKDERKKIFTKFTRGDNSASRKHTGTGLGLYICRKVTRLLGGDVTLDSVKGSGSTFTATIKTVIPDDSTILVPVSRRFSENQNLGDECRLEIVVVDDIAANIMLASSFLKKLGYKPKATFVSADEALKYFEHSTADLILMDVEMPEVNGLELSKKLREMDVMATNGLCPIQIIAVTAGVLPEERKRCINAGMDGYMSKPLTIDSLIVNIKKSYEAIRSSEREFLAR